MIFGHISFQFSFLEGAFVTTENSINADNDVSILSTRNMKWNLLNLLNVKVTRMGTHHHSLLQKNIEFVEPGSLCVVLQGTQRSII